MYREHQPRISEFGLSGPRAFEQVCVFALATIRCPLPSAKEATLKWRETRERIPTAFFGSKHLGLDWLDKYSEWLFGICRQICGPTDEIFDRELMEAFLNIPSIGLAKAGFLSQLLYGRVGCLDTHNIVRYELDGKLSQRGIKSLSSTTQRKYILAYIRLCEKLGGSEHLWDSWCEYVAAIQPYGTAEKVSAMHLAAFQ